MTAGPRRNVDDVSSNQWLSNSRPWPRQTTDRKPSMREPLYSYFLAHGITPSLSLLFSSSPPVSENSERSRSVPRRLHFRIDPSEVDGEELCRRRTKGGKMAFNFTGTQQKCKACDKTVYLMDQLTADGIVFHKSCFKCNHCKGTLTVPSLVSVCFILSGCFSSGI